MRRCLVSGLRGKTTLSVAWTLQQTPFGRNLYVVLVAIPCSSMTWSGKRYVNFHRFPLPKSLRTPPDDALSILRKRFGHESFRGIQQEIINSVTAGRDTLALMPTGGGKSICFQVPGIATGRTTLVVSPLIALMRDQVDNLRRSGFRAAAMVGNSIMSQGERLEIESAALSGTMEFLYASPERLSNPAFMSLIKDCDIGLVAIDEAHCACEWGNDFRPDYLQIAENVEPLGNIPRIALTASAGHQARKEIGKLLLRPGHKVYVADFDRPNILLAADRAKDADGRLTAILHSRRNKGAAIVYTRSREATETVAEALRKQGIDAAAYHAGMSADIRSKTQDDFSAGRIQTIVATSAFGMGIDKSDIATVCHLGMPQGLEAYYQEIGRAGRDGRESVAWASWSPSEAGQRLRKAASLDNPIAMRREVARIEGMLAYLENPPCRRVALLSKFDRADASCGKCDVCLKSDALDSNRSKDVIAILDEISMRPGDYTMPMLVETLLGYPAADVPPATDICGRMTGSDASIVRPFLRQVLAIGLLELDDRYATLSLTPKGADVLMLGLDTLLPAVKQRQEVVKPGRRGRGLPPRLAQEWDRLVAIRLAVSDRVGLRYDQVASDEDLTKFLASGKLPDGIRDEFRLELQNLEPPARHTAAVKGYDTGLF